MSVLLLGRRATRQIQRVSTTLSPSSLLVARTATSTAHPSSGSPRRAFSTFATISLVSAVSLGAYTLGAIYPPPPLSLLYPRPAPPPPSDATSPESLAYTAALEVELQALPALRALREEADADEWYETRPHEAIPESARANKLTSGALRGPGRLALFPLARVRKDERKAVVFVHLGRGLCGHDGIIHGGLLATLLDEVLARNAIINFPEKVGVTATLSLKYKAPTRADQFVIIKSELVELKGRKAFVAGRVETLDGTLLVEADGLFIQPRYAKLLNTAVIRQHMGDPPPPEPALVGEGQGDKLKTSVVPPK
ncbi:4HBT domain-containing protein [Mycena venus]|uniref:4HBT domain-containing protein n=1 Tax=Mycena venus TaxID=2733690 RepID=A0A8H6Y7Q7_9AGAR|nr:4HBT domain-containing protein [Mycena venus]